MWMRKPDQVTIEVLDSVGIITLNSPPANELAVPEFIPLDQLKGIIESVPIKGLIIKGVDKNFSAGGNIDMIMAASENSLGLNSMMGKGHNLLNYIHNLEIPVIAAINRICFGGGLEIALACHIRVASENALLAFPEVNQNLMPGLGGTMRLPSITSFSTSAALILGGDMVNALDAKNLGFIDYVAPKDQAFEYAWTLMGKMTRDRPVKVIRSIMKALKNASTMTPDCALSEETKLFCSLARDEAERRKTEEV
jgi:enoyl-CoA hydratase